jgi:hypothetical protein
MATGSISTNDVTQCVVYQVRIEGQFGRQWTDWFDGTTITQDHNGTTLLTGPVSDQSALYGRIKKLRDLGTQLISISPIETESLAKPMINSRTSHSNCKGKKTNNQNGLFEAGSTPKQ